MEKGINLNKRAIKVLCALTIIVTLGHSVFALPRERPFGKTVIKDKRAKAMLLGRHRFSLQWISWDYFGSANVVEKNGTLFIKGEQRGRNTDEYVTIDGRITEVSAKEFKFIGSIVTKVDINNNGKPCVREGEMTFHITRNRRYWRLKEMDNPCEQIVDYVDIFFR
jgi:hypothetical protein